MGKYKQVGKSVTKIDSLSLATGTSAYTADIRTDHPLYVAFVYSSSAHASITVENADEVSAMPGIRDFLHADNVPRILHTTAGQGYPEPSPYDAVLFDRTVRYVGDRIAAVAAETLEQAKTAAAAVTVRYEPKDPVFIPEEALAGRQRIHGEDAYAAIPVEYDPEHNLAASVHMEFGDADKAYDGAEARVDMTFQTQYSSHCAIEPHAATVVWDESGRLVIYTCTQVPFHVRRIVSKTCEIPLNRIRVIKPRIGGGFGGKQEVFLEPVAALIAWRTKREVKCALSRSEVFVSARTRHPMKVRVQAAASKERGLTAVELDCLMNTGAYGSHALTVLSNAGSKVLPLFNKAEYIRFDGRTAYTNLPVGGAYRGYGATQSYFAFNQALDILCRGLGEEMPDFCKRWHIREGETSDVFKALGEGTEGVVQTVGSCRLDECIDRGRELIEWDTYRGAGKTAADGMVIGVGLSVAMQGSAIPRVDMASAYIKMNDDGSFNLQMGATDLGTGSDTVLAQIAAEALGTSTDMIIVLSSDTDTTPFDTGAYASSTTYLSGNAVRLCAEDAAGQIRKVAGVLMEAEPEGIILENGAAVSGDHTVSFSDICEYALYREDQFQIQATASWTSSVSPPPFAAQYARVAVDPETGKVRLEKFVSVVDCGTPVNPGLAEAQIEGGTVNGISYALCEEYRFNTAGKMMNDSFWDYKIYTANDLPEVISEIADSSEPTGPYGAKSVGEITINGPAPAIANAVFDAVKVRITELPITAERVWNAMEDRKR